MWTKGLLLLGLIVCWTAECNGEEETLYDYGIDDSISIGDALSKEYMFRADLTEQCTSDDDCKKNQICKGEEDSKTCQCADGLRGENCEEYYWCENPEKFKNCKAENGKCEYDEEKRRVVCTCPSIKKLHPEENICKAVECSEDADCKDPRQICDLKDSKTCQCAEGLSGDNCENKDWCGDSGKYKDCKDENGKCDYSAEDKKVVCICPPGKLLHPTENICKDGCSTDNDCNNNQTCVAGADAWKTCHCVEGLSGIYCDKQDWCETGKFKLCNGVNGTCGFVKEKRAVMCTCADDKKKLHPTEKRCRETCTEDKDCANGGKCEEKEGNKFCTCQLGFIGDKCETVFDCSPAGKYKNCQVSGGECKLENDEAVCKCSGIKKLDEKVNECRDSCSKNEDCKDNQECADLPDEEWEACQCVEGLSGNNCEINDWCETGKFKNCKGANGTCGFVKEERAVMCKCEDTKKKLHPTENRCRETCSGDDDCANEQKCEGKDGNKFCTCTEGLVGDKCEIVFDCSAGKYKNCETSGGKCSLEDGKAVCECSGNKALNDKRNKCDVCDCGPEGECSFKNGQKTCKCKEGFELKDGICRETCEDDDDCEHGGKCIKESTSDNSFCKCVKGLSGDTCSIVDACGVNGDLKDCKGDRGDCEYDDGEKKAVCKCTGGKELNLNLNYCQDTCEKNEDCNGGTCEKQKVGEHKFCKCLSGLEGETCDDVTDCISGKYSECKKSGGECGFNKNNKNSECICPKSYALDTSLDKQICKESCSEENKCENDGTCNPETKLCQCKPNTSGDKCGTVDGCDKLKCKDQNAECVYDSKGEKATCKCNENNHEYENGKCVATWCKTVCKGKDTKCEYKNGVGICNCTKADNYYDYASKKCMEIDSCLKCEGDLICINEKCGCPENKKKNDTRCEDKDLCNPNDKCFTGATCEAGSQEYVKCLCTKSQFYHSGKCEDGSCFLPEQEDRASCKKKCPKEMATARDKGICTHKADENKCDKDCGFQGYCYKAKDKEPTCLCDPTYSMLDSKKEKCVLKASAVCPTSEKDGDNKCKCTGTYKPAANGITCELRSCSDEDVQNECKEKRAHTCVDNWKGSNPIGFKCECPQGYIMDLKKGCIDPCSQNQAKDECSSQGRLCYIGEGDKTMNCRCPPTFTYDEASKSCNLGGVNTFMIHNLPVLSKKYESAEKVINKVTLSRDVSKSMKTTFNNLDFVHVFKMRQDNDVLFCDVWLQFQSNVPGFNATLEIQRWKSLRVKVKDQLILPPGLLLSSSHIDEASEEELTLCTPSVLQSICGTGSTCVDNKRCACTNGYREIDSTIRSSGDSRIVRCEDIDECTENTHNCKDNAMCVNTLGSYYCKCKAGFKKEKGDADAMNQDACVDLCASNPCGKGKCTLTKEKTIDCTCEPGYSGSFCNKADVSLAKAVKSTKVVGAVLGTLLGVVIILIIVYIVRQKKNSYSEDFSPAPRIDNAEMVERRPMRGVTNRAYQ